MTGLQQRAAETPNHLRFVNVGSAVRLPGALELKEEKKDAM
jgi:hypothetical protein